MNFFAVEFDDGACAHFTYLPACGYFDVDGAVGRELGCADAVGHFYQRAGTLHEGHGKIGLGDDAVADLLEDDFVDGGGANHFFNYEL